MYSFLFFASLRSAMVRVVKALDYQARALSSSPGQSDVFESSDKICSLSINCDITQDMWFTELSKSSYDFFETGYYDFS